MTASNSAPASTSRRDVGDAELTGPFSRLSNGAGLSLHTNDRAVGTDQAGSQQRHVPKAGPDVEYSHTRTQPGVEQELLGHRRQKLTLSAQPLALDIAMTEDVPSIQVQSR
jgi:hypothetical protein